VNGRALAHPDHEIDEEACYSNCGHCHASLYVIVRFRENTPIEALGAGKEADWPQGYTR
jgi:hypothetical protein